MECNTDLEKNVHGSSRGKQRTPSTAGLIYLKPRYSKSCNNYVGFVLLRVGCHSTKAQTGDAIILIH